MNCLFCKIISGEIPKTFEYQNDWVVVFKDIHPVAPVHLLVVPKIHANDFTDVKDDKIYLEIINTIKKMISDNNLMGKGYRIEVNGGGEQIIPHLHFHLIGPLLKKSSTA